MKNLKELKKHLALKTPLVWNDPDPIKGNDYTITWVENLDNIEEDDLSSILIHYGNGSEAEVYLHEILIK